MINPFAPPLSGPILGDFIDAFDLRRFDHREVLTKRNARRYLAGERTSPEAEAEVHAAVAEAIVEAQLLPPAIAVADLIDIDGRVPAKALESVTLPHVVRSLVAGLAAHWDALAGALRRLSAPVAFPTHAAGACLRLVAIDAAVRLTGLLWLSRTEETAPIPGFWCEERGTSRWLRSLHEACQPPLSRDALAKAMRVHDHTLDGWLDAEVRPTHENLMDLAQCFADHGLGTRDDLLHRLRLAFGARALFAKIVEVVGPGHAVGICKRIVIYANQMLRLPRSSKNPRPERDLKMRLTVLYGTLWREDSPMIWIESMLNHLWRYEGDPVWRTSLKAATRGWFEHLQDVTAKLGPIDEGELAASSGKAPSRETIAFLAYATAATKEELARDPMFAAAMDAEAEEPGRDGALELKIRAGELYRRGDLLGAIDLLREAATRDPLSAEIHFRLGCCLWQIGDVAAGLTELEIAVELKPGWDRARVEIAIVLFNEGRAEEAQARLLEGQPVLDAPSPWLLLHLAHAYERTSNPVDAIRTYEELLALEPHNAEALDRLAHLYFVSRDRRKGADAAKRAAQLGIPTVFRAWEEGYYDKSAPAERPRHVGLDTLIQFHDGPRRKLGG